jgi:cytochrome c553
MTKKVLTIITMVISTLILFDSCEKEENEENEGNETMNSSYNDNESHNMGQNCMNCHIQGGDGEGWFVVAGTVYDSLKTATFPNSTVKLYSGPNGSGNLVATIEVDGLGNFYTTNSINFGNGLYTSASGNTTTQHMNSSISTGNCNSCHGESVDRIWTK